MNDSPITLPEVSEDCSRETQDYAAGLRRYRDRFNSLCERLSLKVESLQEYGTLVIDLPQADSIAHDCKKSLVAELALREAVLVMLDKLDADDNARTNAKPSTRLLRVENEIELSRLVRKLSLLQGKLDSAGKRKVHHVQGD